MMRPACAYSAVVQPGPSNCPDIYGERETFGLVSMQQLPSGQGFYSVSHTGPVGILSNSSPSTFNSQQTSFSIPAYSSIPMQIPYTNSVCTDVLPPGNMAPSFNPQTPSQQYHQTVAAATAVSSIGCTRGPNQSTGQIHLHQTTSVAPSFGTSTNPIQGQTTIPRLPSGSAMTARVQSVVGRSVGSRSQMSMVDTNSFPSQPMYASYSSGNSVAFSAGVGNLPVPYSTTFSGQCVASPIANKASIQMTPASSVIPQVTSGTVSAARSSNIMTISPQQSSMFSTQPLRQPTVVSAYAGTGYSSQSYSVRSGTATPQSMIPRPQTACSPLSSKDLPLGPCTVGPHLSQLSTQLPSCSVHSCSSPNSCSHFLPKGSRSSTVFNQYISANVVGLHGSVTPPAGIIINGPSHSIGQSGMMTTMNGCMNVGPEGDGKPVQCVPDGCYIQNRPISSGTRDMPGHPMPVTGQIGSGSELLISPTFPISSNLSSPVNLPYGANPQQIPVFSGEFDSLSSNPSPMMMMAMPSSSPVPGGPLMNGSVPPGMMNMTPAPPPYHQPSALISCRPVGPSSFFGHPQMSCLTSATGLHTNTISVTEAGMGGLSGDRHFLSPSNDAIATGKRTPTGPTKSAVRPKRSRTNKAATGTGRGNKTNSKKASMVPSTPPMSLPSMIDPFVMNARLTMQPSPRSKPGVWGISNCGSGFPTGLSSPSLSTVSSTDGRQSCSPILFSSSNASLMRPNSGPPQNLLFGPTIQGASSHTSVASPCETCTRLPSSPRLCPSTTSTNTATPLSAAPFRSSYGTQPTGTQHPASVYPASSQPTGSRTPSSVGSFPYMASQQVASTNAVQPPTRTPAGSAFGPDVSCASDAPSTADRSSGSACSNVGPGTSIAIFTGDTDRLVCPITNGMVWGPTQIQLNDIIHQFIPDGVIVRRFEFDLTANHLNTIVGRSDLDIVVCSHLLSEPLQVCHWPSDAVQIRFNEYLLRLDRSSVNGGQSAHKVACVKQLCRPGRNQLEIAIIGLGEDPSLQATMNKRRSIASTLETHRFAAFMAHMPALNVLLDGLKRRRPAGVNVLCDLLDARAGMKPDGSDLSGGQSAGPVVGELNLICPVFRTRMNVPGRITGCEHVEAFDMEAFLRREVLWPRLNCPICGHKSPAGLDGLCIDTTILYALRLVPTSVDRILVRSDGHWRLPPPHYLELPNGLDQWQPLIGPLTEVVTHCLGLLYSGSTWDTRSSQPLLDVPGQVPSSQSFSHTMRSRSFSADIPTSISCCKESTESASPAAHSKHESTNADSNKISADLLPTSRPSSQPVSWSDTPMTASGSVFILNQRPSSSFSRVPGAASPPEPPNRRLLSSVTSEHRTTIHTSCDYSSADPLLDSCLKSHYGSVTNCLEAHGETSQEDSNGPHHTPNRGSADTYFSRITVSSPSIPCSPPFTTKPELRVPNPISLSTKISESASTMSLASSDYGAAQSSEHTISMPDGFRPSSLVAELSSEQKSTSSLNKGLDYLLAEEHTMVNHSAENGCDYIIQASPISKLCAHNQADSFESTSGVVDEKIPGKPASSVASDVFRESHGGTVETRGQCVFGNREVQNTLVSQNAEQPNEGGLSDSFSKRIKLDPSLHDPDRTGSVEQTMAIGKLEEEQCKPSVSSPKLFAQCGGIFKNWRHPRQEELYSDVSSPFTVTAHFEEEHLCADAIHSLSAQIDRIEIFLDDSYLRFVENFPCT